MGITAYSSPHASARDRGRCCAIVVALVLESGASATAQTAVARFDHPPAIDGSLSDPAWRTATRFTAFRTLHPQAGREPSESTEVYLAYDDSIIYVGVRSSDRAADSIQASAADLEGVWHGDWVAFCLDPQDGGLDAYYFLVTPAGFKVAGVLGFDGGPVQTVDRIWTSAVRRLPRGYTIEMAISLAQLPHSPGDTVRMAFKVARAISRRGEEMDFPAIDPNRPHVAQFQRVVLTAIARSREPYGRPLFDERVAYREKVRRLARYGDSTMEGRVEASTRTPLRPGSRTSSTCQDGSSATSTPS